MESRPADTAIRAIVCCRRPMTGITVTQPRGEGVSVLSLYSCGGCGRHLWERDGQPLQRNEVLQVVKERLAEGPAPRVPKPRSRR